MSITMSEDCKNDALNYRDFKEQHFQIQINFKILKSSTKWLILCGLCSGCYIYSPEKILSKKKKNGTGRPKMALFSGECATYLFCYFHSLGKHVINYKKTFKIHILSRIYWFTKTRKRVLTSVSLYAYC